MKIDKKIDINQLAQITEGIKGWLIRSEGELLYNLAKKCTGKGVIVEIGSWEGRSATWLAVGSKNGKSIPVYAIDPHITSKGEPNGSLEGFEYNITRLGLNDIVNHITERAELVAPIFDKPVELIFIDGFHQYEHVKMDFEQWILHVVDNGYIAIHDTLVWDGPVRLVDELSKYSKNFRILKFVHDTTLGQKVKNYTFFDRIRGLYIIYLKKLYTKIFVNTEIPPKKKDFYYKIINFLQF